MTLHARNGKTIRNRPICSNFYRHGACLHPAGEQFAVQLDRTAFYPEGGGQPCDTGALGTALVTDVQEHGGVITHTVSAALPVGRQWKAALIGRAAATIWSSTPVNTF